MERTARGRIPGEEGELQLSVLLQPGKAEPGVQHRLHDLPKAMVPLVGNGLADGLPNRLLVVDYPYQRIGSAVSKSSRSSSRAPSGCTCGRRTRCTARVARQ